VATCAGCDIDSNKFPIYTKENPVTEDGTYFNGKFVCDSCYLKLERINHNLSVGRPDVLQNNAIVHLRK
jgi:hypothetical protein